MKSTSFLEKRKKGEKWIDEKTTTHKHQAIEEDDLYTENQ